MLLHPWVGGKAGMDGLPNFERLFHFFWAVNVWPERSTLQRHGLGIPRSSDSLNLSQIIQQKTVEQTAQFRERRATKTLQKRLKNPFAPTFLPFGIAKEALRHCDRAFIAMRKSLCGEAIEA
jgi:hypothetical protein